MADAGSAIMPGRVKITCPRCHFTSHFVPDAALAFRCVRCEWLFTLAAPVVTVPTASPVNNQVYTNTSGTVVAATITTASGVTAINVNGVSTGATSGLILIPAGGTIALTWATTQPTMAWALPQTSASVSAGGTALTFAPAGTNVAFALSQVLIVDPSGTSDVVVVSGTPTATSVPVNSLNSAHNSGVSVTIAQLAPANSGEQGVPQAAY